MFLPTRHALNTRNTTGVKRSLVSKLGNEHFGQDPKTNAAVVTGMEMRPTLGMNVVVQLAGRALSQCHNLKRHMVDPSHSLSFA